MGLTFKKYIYQESVCQKAIFCCFWAFFDPKLFGSKVAFRPLIPYKYCKTIFQKFDFRPLGRSIFLNSQFFRQYRPIEFFGRFSAFGSRLCKNRKLGLRARRWCFFAVLEFIPKSKFHSILTLQSNASTY